MKTTVGILLAIGCALPLSLAACGSTATDTTPAADAGTDAAGQVDSGIAPDAGPKVDNGAPSTTYPAAHPAMPQLVNQAGGKTLATPKVHLVFFPGYKLQADLITFAQGIGKSSYWGPAVTEYGVGAVEYAGMTELADADGVAPTTITDAQVEAFMNAHIASGTFGTPDPSVIYTIFYPQTTTITMAGGGPLGPSSSCMSFGGYHSDTFVTPGDAGAPQNYAFAVIPTCASFGGLTGIDGVSGATSHEWIEAATDPFPSTNMGLDSAFSGIDEDHLAWELLGGGGEDGDLCVSDQSAFYKPADFPFTVQRGWSNALAKAGHNPCAPNVAGVPYFQSAPVLNEKVQFTAAALGGTFHTKGVVIPVGQSKVIELDLFSDAATSGPWTVSAVDPLAQYLQMAPTLGFAFDRTTGVNGEKLHLTITVKATQGLAGGAHPFIVVSNLGGKSGVTHTWAGVVTEK
jgi:hypothetical protein